MVARSTGKLYNNNSSNSNGSNTSKIILTVAHSSSSSGSSTSLPSRWLLGAQALAGLPGIRVGRPLSAGAEMASSVVGTALLPPQAAELAEVEAGPGRGRGLLLLAGGVGLRGWGR